jgi:hypothetical protein
MCFFIICILLCDTIQVGLSLLHKFYQSYVFFSFYVYLANSGEEFRKRLDVLITQSLRKGVPPLFNNLRSLYRDAEKVRQILVKVLSLFFFS